MRLRVKVVILELTNYQILSINVNLILSATCAAFHALVQNSTRAYNAPF